MHEIDEVQREYEEVKVTVLGRSILGREIPVITLGEGAHTVLYVGAQRGEDARMAGVLLQFVREYLFRLRENALVFERRMKYFFAERTVKIIPMLNPDGVEYATHGVSRENPLYERVRGMNGSEDFSHWCANARGVDLQHNFEVGFFAHREKTGVLSGAPALFGGEYPESEPETAAVSRYIRANAQELRGVMGLEIGKEGVRCPCADKLSAKSMAVGRLLQKSTGFHLKSPQRLAYGGGLGEWCIECFGRPAYTVSCGEATPPLSDNALFGVLRRALFTFPFML